MWDKNNAAYPANATKFKLIKDEWTGTCFHQEDLVDEEVTIDAAGDYHVRSITNFDDGHLMGNKGGFSILYSKDYTEPNLKDYFNSEGVLLAQNVYGNYPLAYDEDYTYGLLTKTEDFDAGGQLVKSTAYEYESDYHHTHPVFSNTKYPYLNFIYNTGGL